MPTPAEIVEIRRRAKARAERAESGGNGTDVRTTRPAQDFQVSPLKDAEDKGGGGLGGFISRLTSPLVDIPDLPLGIVGEGIERGVEELSSPLGLASAALIPVTGGASLGLRGALGAGARLATRGAAEVAVGGAASIAANEALERLPEDTPGIARLGAALAAGAAGGIGTSRAISTGVKQLPGAVKPAAINAPVKTPEAQSLVDAIVNAPKLRGRQFSKPDIGAQMPKNFRGSRGQFMSRRKFEATSVAKMKETIDTHYIDVRDRRAAKSGLNTLLAGSIPANNELLHLEDVFGAGLIEAVRLHQGWGPQVAAAINLPRALVATADLSAPLRQGIMLIPRHPLKATKNFGAMIRAFVDKDYFDQAVAALDEGAQGLRARNAGLARTAGKALSREESFLGNAFGLPKTRAGRALGAGEANLATGVMRASERAYSLFLDKLRRDVFDGFTNKLDQTGIQSLKTEKEYAAFLNRATGRGAEQILQGNLGKVANASFFAPNYTISRFLAPTSLLTSDPVVRKMVAQDLGAFIGSGVAGLGLLAYAAKEGLIPGLSVEADPRSSDFGKIRIGNQRYDFWGGYQQIARTTAQYITGEYKSPSSGRVDDADRLETLGRFIQSKLSPVAGLFVDVNRGETYMGDKLDASVDTLGEQAVNRLTPLVFQDILEGYESGGTREAVGALPAFFGVGVTTFQSLAEIKNDTALRLFNKEDYRDLTRAEKQAVDNDPRVLEKEAEYDGKAGNDYSTTIDEIENNRLRAQQAFVGQLANGMFDYRSFADAIEEGQLRSSVAKQQARRDYEIPDAAPPSSPLQIALDEYYNLYDLADYGAEQGVKSGQIDWSKWEDLRTSLYSQLTPEQIEFIEASIGGGAESDPLTDWYFSNKKYVQDSPYWDAVDSAYKPYERVLAGFDINSYGDLTTTMNNIRYRNPALYKRLNSIQNKIEKKLSTERERLRKRDPKLDAALYLTGRTTTLLTPSAERIARGEFK